AAGRGLEVWTSRTSPSRYLNAWLSRWRRYWSCRTRSFLSASRPSTHARRIGPLLTPELRFRSISSASLSVSIRGEEKANLAYHIAPAEVGTGAGWCRRALGARAEGPGAGAEAGGHQGPGRLSRPVRQPQSTALGRSSSSQS